VTHSPQERKKMMRTHKIWAALGAAVLAVGLAAPLAPIASADDNCNPLVTVYQDIDRKGASWKYCSTGSIEAYGGARGLPNDTISSIEVAYNVVVYLYEHAGAGSYGGRSLGPLNARSTLTIGSQSWRPYYNLTDYNFNDIVSSLAILLNEDPLHMYMDVNPTDNAVSVVNYYGYGPTGATTMPANLNDKISAIYVPWGWAVTVWEHADFKGAHLTLYAGLHNLTMYTLAPNASDPSYPSWNDVISSYQFSILK
jgi:hypothetical protein